MRTIGVVTVGRSDYGIYRPLLQRIQSDSDLKLHLIVGGMHFSPAFGTTVKEIEADGFPIAARVEHLEDDDSPEAIAVSMGRGTMGFARVFAQQRPEILVVLGDRFEMHAAALAALPFNIPVAHIHGGELTEGAIDDALRHSITKLSHLHFVATGEYARRVIQLGEEPWRVMVSGAPSLDNLRAMNLLKPHELEAKLGLQLDPAPLLVTFHPATLDFERAEAHVGELLAALEKTAQPVVFTAPNADTNGRIMAQRIQEFVRAHPTARYFETLGTRAYFSLMSAAAAMVGNSSSGLVEAPSFHLPVVNIGDRQQGRVRAANVIDVGCRREEISRGIQQACSTQFHESLRGLVNPYGNGEASEKIVARLQEVPLDGALLHKHFHDLKA